MLVEVSRSFCVKPMHVAARYRRTLSVVTRQLKVIQVLFLITGDAERSKASQ